MTRAKLTLLPAGSGARIGAMLLAVAAFVPGGRIGAGDPPRSVTDADVTEHIENLRDFLLGAQRSDGSWSHGGYQTGLTSLVVLALRHAGVAEDHPSLRKAVQYILRNFEPYTYSESLVICALEQFDAETYARRIRRSVRYLVRAQQRNGAWSYTGGRRGWDNSNTQFAVLGLAAAERCGVEIPESTRRRAVGHWIRSQSTDGGWGYSGRGSRLSMTCAGIASLHLLGREYERPQAGCGRYEYDERVQRGLRAMLRQLREGSRRSYSSYALYALERVGMFLDLKEVDDLDWYRWGAERIVGRGAGRSISDRAFDLLFLAKGEAQVAIAKWRWSGDWNNDHQDVKNWVSLAGSDLGKKLDWLPARLDRADSPAARASLLFVSGHGRFEADESEVLRLREFLGNRGTLVAEGCCESRVFIESFQSFVNERLYPGHTVGFRMIRDDHAVCAQKYVLSAEQVSALEARTGCHRRRILLLTRDISCALNGEPADEAGKDRARRVAVNLLQWAMETKRPEGKLSRVAFAGGGEEGEEPGAGEPRREPGLTRRYRQPFGRLIHRGEWDVDKRFFPTLRDALAGNPAAPVFDGEVFVDPASDDLYSCAVLYVTGHDDPKLRRAEWLPLRRYLQNGGSILASACCGFEGFDRGFRQLLTRLLPNDEVERVPDDDALWKAPYDRGSLPVEGSKAWRRKHGGSLAPLYGVRRAGRWVVLYSPVDICCDLEGDLDPDTVAYRKATAVPIWTNLLYYVSTP